jgi:hypothetical protein
MPLKSTAQAAFFSHHHPDLLKEFAAETPKGTKLPHYASQKPKTAAQNLYGK